MQTSPSTSEQPFWVDDANPYQASKNSRSGILPWLSISLSIVTLLIRIGVFIFFFYLAFKYPIFWIFVALETFVIGIRVFATRWKKFKQLDQASIQKRAKELTGAEVIGSALHTAGHPLLQVNQPVVLALKGDELSLYDYKNSNPIDTIHLKDLQSVDTIVYDEDRVPHIGVADNTAQAMQLTFNFRGNPCTCVFRRMYKVRAIEWYQAIQKARLT